MKFFLQIKHLVPNILTVLRIPMALLCAYFALTLKQTPLIISLSLFLLAAITDFFDGFLARRWKIVSDFGKILDPIADKLLILSVFFVFSYHEIIPIGCTILIFLREVFLTIVRLLLLTKKVVLASRYSGKVKTVTQIAVLIVIYTILIFKADFIFYFGKEIINSFIWLMAIWTVCITLYSGYEVLSINRKQIGALVD